MKVWFRKKFPSGKFSVSEAQSKIILQNFESFLFQIGRKFRPILKLARIGLAVKTLISTALTYFDLTTDAYVTRHYFKIGSNRWGWASASCLIAGILVQVLITFAQYRKRPWK